MNDSHDQLDAWLDTLELDDQPAPAPRIHSADADALIQRVLQQAEQPAHAELSEKVVALPPRGQRSLLERAAVAAVILLGLSGSASAALYIYREVRDIQAEERPQSPPPTSAVVTVEPSKPAPILPEPIPEEEVAPAQAQPPAVPLNSAPPKPRATKPTSPDALLRKANAHRAAGRWRAADALYGRLLREAPRSQTAHVASVASGDLRLARLEDPRGALRRYRAALRAAPDGWLAEDARYGIVESLRRLERPSEERQALQKFLLRHPRSARARQARQRLDRIEPRPAMTKGE